MALNSYNAKVPGSLMLFGEHAVLHGKKALVCAINKYISVNLVPINTRDIKIFSNTLGTLTTTIDNLQIVTPFTFVLNIINSYRNLLPSGFELNITTEFSDKVGFGSSAAVTVATIAVFENWIHQQELDLIKIYKTAKNIAQTVQKIGSGADIAASIFGGILLYQTTLESYEKLIVDLPLTAIYSGSKTTTLDAIYHVEKLRSKYSKIFAKLFDTMEECTNDAYLAIKMQNFVELGALMNIHNGLQDAINVNNAILAELVFALRSYREIFGAKISGAGLGDCLIGLGTLPPDSFPQTERQYKLGVKQFALKISEKGLSY